MLEVQEEGEILSTYLLNYQLQKVSRENFSTINISNSEAS